MKKAVSVLLIIVMMMTTVNVVMAENTSDDIKIKLTDMGIYEADLFNGNRITRGDFSRLLLNFMNLDNTGKVESTRFIDVPVSHRDAYSINVLYDMGYVNGFSGYLFKPDANITYHEAIYMVLALLGYDSNIIEGDYPYTGLYQAQSLKLLNGIENTFGENDELTENDALILLYNALSTKMIERVYSTTNLQFKESEKTAYDHFWKMTVVTGILTANPYTGLYAGIDATKKGYIRIEDEIFKTDKDYSNLLGYRVRCYYEDNNDNADKIVVSVEKLGRNSVAEANGQDIISCTDSVIEYYDENDNKKRINFDGNGNTAVIFNGVAYSGYGRIRDIVNEKSRIVAIDNDADGIADVLDFTEFDDYYVSRIDVKNGIITDDLNSDTTVSRKIVVEDDDIISRVYDSQGNLIEFKDIAIGQVAAVAKSKNTDGSDTVITVYMINNKVTGKVTGTSEKADAKTGLEYEIGGNMYELADAYNLKNKIELGTEGDFYLTADGKIIARTLASASDNIGIIQEIGVSSNVFNNKVLVKMYTQDGKSEMYTMADKVMVDKVSVKSKSLNLNVQKFAPGSIIMYTLNDDGMIKTITTPKEYGDGEKGEFRKLIESGNSFSVVANIVNGVAAPVEGRTVMLSAPSDPSDEKAYGIVSFSAYKTQLKNKKFDMYSFSDDELDIIDVLVGYDAAKTMLNDEVSDIYIVDGIYMGLTSDEQEARMFDVINPNTASVEKMVISPDLTTSVSYTYNNLHGTRIKCVSDSVIDKGDVIRVAKNASGEVTSIELVWDYDYNDNPDAKLRFSDDSNPKNDYVDTAHYYADGKYIEMGRLITAELDTAYGNFIQYETSSYRRVQTGTDESGNPIYDYTLNWRNLGKHIADSDDWASGFEPKDADVELHKELTYMNSDANMIVYDADTGDFKQIKRADLSSYKGKRCIISIHQNLLQRLIIFE